MKKIFILLLTLEAVNLCAQVSWQSMSIDSTLHLNYVKFINSQTGWATTNNQILKTTDGGQNWTNLYSTEYVIYDKFFNNSQVVWRSSYIGAIPPSGVLWKSTNDGLTWIQVMGGFNGYSNLFFLNDLTGWTTTGSTLYRTTNGGSSWQTSALSGFYNYGLFFVDSSYGFYYSSTCYIYKSTNSGINWTQISHTNVSIQSDTFLDSITGYLCGNINDPSLHGVVLKTTNGGYNWTEVFRDTNQINRVFFVNSNTGYALGISNYSNSNTIYRTSNGGLSWSTQIPDTERSIKAIYFINAYTGWLVGNYGIIMHTTNGGSTYLKNINSTIPEKSSLSQNYPNPFNPKTKISFQLSVVSFSSLKIFDITGKEVATLVNEKLEPGTYAVDWNASEFPSGVYFYRLQTDSYTEVKKMSLIK